MWVIAQSGEIVNISDARWIDCVEDHAAVLKPGDEVGAGAPWPRWKVRVFYTGREKGLMENIFFRGTEAEAKAVLAGLTALVGAYNLKGIQATGFYRKVAEETGTEGGRVLVTEEPVLRGRETII